VQSKKKIRFFLYFELTEVDFLPALESTVVVYSSIGNKNVALGRI